MYLGFQEISLSTLNSFKENSDEKLPATPERQQTYVRFSPQ